MARAQPGPGRPRRQPAKKPSAQEEAPVDRDESSLAAIRRGLIDWYRRGHRDLPWRRVSDPYAIWISEIMLQQTRVETVKERYTAFLERFPTIAALAAAPIGDVLSLWSGLGYYARARNLHAAAVAMVERYGGRFPEEADEVATLPGIGPYTRGAILSIAFGQSQPILDGNVIRVLSRLYAIAGDIKSTATRNQLWELARRLVPPSSGRPGEASENDAGDFNQALMELGATVCLPQSPICLVCPLSSACEARRTGEPDRFPHKSAARPVPVINVVTLVAATPGAEVLLLQRQARGLWGGLWEPAMTFLDAAESPETGLARLLSEGLGMAAELADRCRPLPPFVHVLSHRELRFTPYLLPVERPLTPRRHPGYESARWVPAGGPLSLGLSAWVSRLLGRVAAHVTAPRSAATAEI